jgi:hypothetical protein
VMTRIDYLYRDASNYKFWGHFVVSGELAMDQLRDYMLEREWFIPGAVGLLSLVPECRSEDDHDLHEICDCRSVANEQPVCSASEFVRRMAIVSNRGWHKRQAFRGRGWS